MNMMLTGSMVETRPALNVRLARHADEIDAAQALRYRVFFEEMGARPDADAAASRRDRDAYDDVADHLLVIDPAAHAPHGIVATYRLLDAAAAARAGGFYTAGEFDLGPLLRSGRRMLELGRSCVDPGWRSGAVMQLLWRGIAEVVQARGIDVMFGCASLHGTEVATHAAALSLLANRHLAPRALRPQALAERHVDLRQLPEGAYDPRAAFLALPPLLKGYLRVGGWVGDGAVIDHDFNTIDVAVVVPTEGVTARYARHYDTARVA